MSFTFQDWLLSFGVYLLAGLGFILIGCVPFYMRPSSAAAVLFFMVSAISVWFTSTFDFMTTRLLPTSLRVFAFALTPAFGIHLGLVLTKGSEANVVYRLAPAYLASVVLGSWYSATFHHPDISWPLAVQLTYFYCLLAAVLFLFFVFRALHEERSPLEKDRLRVVRAGAVIGFFLPTLGAALGSLFVWQIPFNLLLVTAVFFPLSVAYALARYSLFDMGAVLKLSLTRGALTAVLLLIYVVVISALGFTVDVSEASLLAPALFSTLIVLIFNPMLQGIEAVVDRYVYRREYDLDGAQEEIGFLLRTLSEPRNTAQRYLSALSDKIGIGSAALYFRPTGPGSEIVASVGTARPEVVAHLRTLQSGWVACFGLERRGIFRDEIEGEGGFAAARGAVLDLSRLMGVELMIPIVFGSDVRGIVAWGRKKSGQGYSVDDVKLLIALTDQLALSLENGVLFEESERAGERYRQLYDKAEMMNQQLIKVDKPKKEFVANISHELRTPISAILGYAEVLMDSTFRGDSRPVLDRITTAGQELSQLMDSLLDFSRAEANQLSATWETVRIREMLHSLELMALRLIKNRPIRFRLDVDARLDVIRTDAKKIQQILTHFLTNALKFTHEGEVALTARLVPTSGDPLVEISVADTGIGISAENRELIFEDFRQLDGSSTRKYGGTGVGLGLCRRLAASVGGSIRVESQVGHGSEFTIVLPTGRRTAGFHSRAVQAMEPRVA
jgi:signal transduction histidine kinase